MVQPRTFQLDPTQLPVFLKKGMKPSLDWNTEKAYVARICVNIDNFGNAVYRREPAKYAGSSELYVKGKRVAEITQSYYKKVFPNNRAPKIEDNGYFRMYSRLMDKIIEHDLSWVFINRKEEILDCIAAYEVYKERQGAD